MRGHLTLSSALLVTAACLQAVAQHTLELIEESGPAENRVDLLIMGDGYAADEQDTLAADALATLDNLRDKRPFGQYADFFNVALISTISAETGADHPGESLYADTFFGCAYDCMGLDRLICCDDAAVFSVAGALYPAHDVILLIVNDPEYGGSGGAIAVTSNNVQSFEVPPHEFGHTFAMLGDEYDDPYPGYVCEDIFPNVSFTADADDLKWIHWVEDGTPLPTPGSAAIDDLLPVGAYEGACYQPTGMYRPAPECLMRALGSDMCAVCAEALVLSLYGYVEPIDAFSPEGAAAEGAAGDTLEFSVEAVAPEPDTLEYAWSLDGEDLAGENGDSLELELVCISPGGHSLGVDVRDGTGLVREDPEERMGQQSGWSVTRTDDGPVEDCWTEDPDSGTDADTDSDTSTDTGAVFVPIDGTAPAPSGCGCDTADSGRAPSFISLLIP